MRDRIIEAILDRIKTQGIGQLSARDVAKAAGCSAAAIYTVFEDFDHAIFAANARTLERMGAALAAVEVTADDPGAGMRKLARAYVRFALENEVFWWAVFNQNPAETTVVPDWYHDLHARLISQIFEPLKTLRPDLDEEGLSLRARTLFSSVHGVVLLSLERRFVGVPADRLEEEVDALVAAMTRGLGEN
ncbi:TetR-like C-terminal domain-containing protein [Pseudoruegeria sp. HB172150]|uniref:TetR-like C-terminal domain-containing protein n=1 Tax=Pseudoruegeria sp. HB172150 TaxID=2721164 RepID=UPI001552B755|nr:TetR-like C-terminal domain-containing protein [Pseudoruegeria sp. HB172150]